MVYLPCTPGGAASWEQRTTLDGREFVLAFDWNQRTGQWSLALADQDGVAIASGRALVVGHALLQGCVDPRRPPGELLVDDATGATDLDPGFADLGARFRLVYLDAAELGR